MQRRRLKPDAVPSQFSWTKQPTSADVSRTKRYTERCVKREGTCEGSDELSMDVDVNCDLDIAMEVNVNSEKEKVHNQAIQTDLQETLSTSVSTHTQTESETKVQGFTIHDFKNDPKGVHYYTGLQDYLNFMDVLASLGPCAFELTYVNGKRPSLSVPDQLFLTILKCRRYTANFELSRMFKVSESEVYTVFATWIRFMHLQWREIDIWADRDMVFFYAPSDFKTKFPSTRSILDGFEFPVKKPKAPAAQQVTFSTYKNRNTAKALVGITPGGLMSYMSGAYGGSTSDRQIIERSGLINKVNKGDSIMADKSFDVQDLFAPVDVTVNIPTFFKNKNRMTGQSVVRDRKISRKRVHVERIIGLGKTYKILTQPLNHTETILSSDIAFICFMLVNFRKCIVSR